MAPFDPSFNQKHVPKNLSTRQSWAQFHFNAVNSNYEPVFDSEKKKPQEYYGHFLKLQIDINPDLNTHTNTPKTIYI